MKNRIDESFDKNTWKKAFTGHTNIIINIDKIRLTSTGTIQPSKNINKNINKSINKT